MTATGWGWLFLVAYVLMMLGIGIVGMRKTTDADSFATARGAYRGPLLALAYMATIGSGATFMGNSGISYEAGFKGTYIMLSFTGALLGSLFVARRLKFAGDRMGSLTIPDFLGDLFRSPILRVALGVVSIFLIYYVMAQLVAAGQLFETLLRVPYKYGITAAMVLILIYMVIGGSHSDIITDAVQGFLMLVVAAFVLIAFLVGLGVDGVGPAAVNAALPEQQRWHVHTDPNNPLFANWWTIALLFGAHLGFVCLPHVGNKFWAMRGTSEIRRFFVLASMSGVLVSLMTFGGVLARAMGLDLAAPDRAIPGLFLELLPGWAAGLLLVTILSAIVSTSDGLMMSISQIFANDLYRKTWVPWRGQDPRDPRVDRRSLLIGRVTMALVGGVAVAGVWTPPELLSVLQWVGIGGIISAAAGPLFVGLLWRGATPIGALLSALSGFGFFAGLHLGPQFGLYAGISPWNANPFSTAAVGMVVSVVACVLFSRLGTPSSTRHPATVSSTGASAEHENAS